MTRFFTSDHHFGHANIINLANRPFNTVNHMNEVMIEKWNAVVKPTDTVYHLGDFALGSIADTLPLAARLNGFKVLIVGNHDRIFKGESKKRIKRFDPEYRKVFQTIWKNGGALTISGINVLLSHFPYDSDSHGQDRYKEYRFKDKGIPVIHGHVHQKHQVSFSERGTLQVHIGVDAWNFEPVPQETIYELIKG